MGNEQVRKLEKRAMAGIGIDDQLGSRYLLRKVVGVDRRNHDVIISIHNQGWLPDAAELGVPFAGDFAPGDDRGSLGGHGLRLARPIRVMLAEMPPLPKRLARGLARRRRTEEKIEKGFERAFPGLGVRGIAPFSDLRVFGRLAAARSSASKDEASRDFWMAESERLGDVSTDRVAENVNRRKAKRADKIGRAIRHGFHGVGRLTAGSRHPGIIKQDNGPAPGEAVGD